MSQEFNWTNELTLRFIEVLSTERVLWDSSDPGSKTKHKVNEAWNRVSRRMNVPLEILRTRKKILVDHWRHLFKKKMATIKSGVAEDKIFKPIWYAYEAMESFLGSVYDADGTLNEYLLHVYEESTAPSSPSTHSQHNDDTSTSLTIKTESQDRADRSTQTDMFSANKRKRSSEFIFDGAEHDVSYGCDPLRVSQGVQHDERQRFERSGAARRGEEEDECDIYAKLLARKLRKYPGRMRDRIMYKIDGLLLDNPYPDENYSSPRSSYS